MVEFVNELIAFVIRHGCPIQVIVIYSFARTRSLMCEVVAD